MSRRSVVAPDLVRLRAALDAFLPVNWQARKKATSTFAAGGRAASVRVTQRASQGSHRVIIGNRVIRPG